MKTNSPFIIKQDFLSPLLCEQIVDILDFTVPDIDNKNNPIKTLKFNDKAEEAIFERVTDIIPEIETKYDIKHEGTELVAFEWFSQGCKGEDLHSENSNYLRKKWVRTKPRDITGIIFLSEYKEKPPFDPFFEVYGGKLQFPQHGMSFNPERGTLILFPSVPHFINAIGEITIGDLYIAKFHIAAKKPFLYNPENFPGDYKSWLLEYL